jgi:hypothetical protein
MGVLAILGLIAIVVGFLSLFSIIHLSLPVALLFIVGGVLAVVFGGGVGPFTLRR